LEHEEQCESILKDFFVENDRNKQGIIQCLKYIKILSDLNNELFCDFNIFTIDNRLIRSEKTVFEKLI
jgi:hypothetical protein